MFSFLPGLSRITFGNPFCYRRIYDSIQIIDILIGRTSLCRVTANARRAESIENNGLYFACSRGHVRYRSTDNERKPQVKYLPQKNVRVCKYNHVDSTGIRTRCPWLMKHISTVACLSREIQTTVITLTIV